MSGVDQGEALAALAASLSPAMRDALKTLPLPGYHADRIFVGVYRHRSFGSIWRKSSAHWDAMLALEDVGLVERKVSRGETLWRPTRPLGLALREHIQTNMEGER